MIILIIEDEKPTVDDIKNILERESYLVDVAYTGESGLEKARVNDYDAIILDILLPNMDGFAVCKELRKMKISTPILMLTCLNAVEERVKGLDCGAEDYLPKPFHVPELQARLRALLRREKHVKPTILQVGDLVLDPAKKEVRRSNRVISLTATEYRLLDYMMRRPGQLCYRTMLKEHVWGYNTGSYESKSVNTFMSTLRKKIDHGFRRRLIHTVRDYGYKIQDTTPSSSPVMVKRHYN